MAEQTPAAPRPHIVSVESNVKGAPFKYDLTPRTLIIGNSRTGKTGITNAVELALTGRASDVRGREDVAEAGMLMALAPGRQGTLFAEVTFSDGTKARWETSAAGKGSAKAPKHSVPAGVDVDNVLPLRIIKKVITAETSAARRELLAWIAQGVTHADVEALIPTPLQGRYRSLLVAAGTSDTPVDRLLAATEQAKKEARDAGVRAKAAEKIAMAGGGGTNEAPPSDDEVARAEAALKAAKERLEFVVREDAKSAASQRVQNSIEGAQQELSKINDIIAKLDADLVRLQADAEAKRAEMKVVAAQAVPLGPAQQAKLVIMAKAAAGVFGGKCFCCNTEVGLDRLQAEYAEFNAMAQARLAAMNATADIQAAVTAIENEIATTQHQRSIRESAKNSLMSSMTTFASMKGDGKVEVKVDRSDVEKAREAEAAAQTMLQSVQARKTTWGSTKRSLDAVEAEQQTQAEWKRLEAACDKAVEMLLDRHVTAVETRVQARLPKQMEFGLQLRDGARGVFELGFKRGGVLNSAVSGGEWSLMTAAMADAFAPATGPSIVIPFDRQMDPGTMAAALEAWSRCESQVIVATVVEPARIPKGWKVIRLPDPTPLEAPATVPAAEVKMSEKTVDVAANTTKENPAVTALVEDQKIAAQEQAKPVKLRKLKRHEGESDEAYAARCAEPAPKRGAKAAAAAAAAAAAGQTGTTGSFSLGPCPECGAPMDRENSSTLGGGRVVHVGCPSKTADRNGLPGSAVTAEEMAEAVARGPTMEAAGGRIKLYDIVAKPEQGEQAKTVDRLDTTGIAAADPNLPTV